MGSEDITVTVETYRNQLGKIAKDKNTLVKAVSASKFLANDSKNEFNILENATTNSQTPQTNLISSEVNAQDQADLIKGWTVRYIATSKNFSEISQDPNFNELVIKSLSSWRPYKDILSDEETSKIAKSGTRLKEQISGTLWTIYKEELQENYSDLDRFANNLFPEENGSLHADSNNEGLITEISTAIDRLQ
jgi:hypothetical protein